MKRKAILLAKNTLVVSLPAKWVQQNSITKGQDIDIDIKDKILILKTEDGGNTATFSIKADISGMSSSLVWNYLNALYRTGVNEIEIFFNDQELVDIKTDESHKTMDVVSRITDKLIGMEIIKQSRNSCVLKEITSLKGEEYHNVMNRVFLSLFAMADDIIKAIEAQDIATLENIHMYSEININKLSDYCTRILNTNGLRDFKETDTNYLMTFLLEEVGDSYAEIARIMCGAARKKLAVETNEIYRMTADLLGLSHKFFLNPKREYYLEFHERRNSVKKKVDALVRSEKKHDDEILVFLKIILDKLMEFNNSKLTSIGGF